MNKYYEEFEFHSLYHEIHNFCAVDLSSFYLDIIKDKLYTAYSDSVERRACQTVLFYILDGLVRLIAPVLSFTAEEIWQHLKEFQDIEESIFFASWPDVNHKYVNKELEIKWEKILRIRKDVLKALEIKRGEGYIGNSLEASVNIYVEKKEVFQYLSSFEKELNNLFIVSKVELFNQEKTSPDSLDFMQGIEVPEIKIAITKAPGNKCERCWCYSEKVGEDEKYPTICEKCSSVMHNNFES